MTQTADSDGIRGLEERLREGVKSVPTNEFETDLYDIDDAETAMAQAADAIARLKAQRDEAISLSVYFRQATERAEAERGEARADINKLHATFAKPMEVLRARAEAAEARLEEAKAVLEPFSDIDDPEQNWLPDETPMLVKHEQLVDLTLTLGHFRAARAFLHQGGEE